MELGTTVAKTALASWLLPEEKATVTILIELGNSAVIKTEPTLGCINKQAGLVLVHGANVPLFVVVLPRFSVTLLLCLLRQRGSFSVSRFPVAPFCSAVTWG